MAKRRSESEPAGWLCAIILTMISIAAVPATVGAQQARPNTVTFAKDVAPIFQTHCQSCHRPGSIGPMSLLTYEEARPWARSIKREVRRPYAPVASR